MRQEKCILSEEKLQNHIAKDIVEGGMKVLEE